MYRIFLTFIVIILIFINCTGIKGSKQGFEVSKYTESTDLDEIEELHVDIFPTNKGNLKLALLNNMSFVFSYNGKIIYVDPCRKAWDFSEMPKADLILLTNHHPNCMDSMAIKTLQKETTHFIMPESCNEMLGYGEVMKNNSNTVYDVVFIESVPAYNMLHKNNKDEHYHPRGIGNGYILTFCNKKVYIAGYTENIPEMNLLKNKIDIAFLPKKLPDTMNDEMFADAAQRLQPDYLFPYYYSDFDYKKMRDSLSNNKINILLR